jgi:hypothetical protein
LVGLISLVEPNEVLHRSWLQAFFVAVEVAEAQLHPVADSNQLLLLLVET